MCDKCDDLEKELEQVKKKHSPLRWWIGLSVTIIIFVISQVFLYGKIVGQIETHITNDPTHRELTEEFVTKQELGPRLRAIEEMLKYLYTKEGGKQ